MATGGQIEAGWNLVKVGTLNLQVSDDMPWYTSIVVCQDKIVVIDSNIVQLFRLHDGKLLAMTGRLESEPRDLCLMDAMTICVLHEDGLIEMVSIDSTDMSRVLKTTWSLRLRGVMDEYHGVVRFKDNLVVSGVKQSTMYWCIVSLDDGHVDTIHQICKRNRGWCRVTTKDNIIYISCGAGVDTGVYGFDILNPTQCKYTYKHQRLQIPTSIVINEDGNIFVCDNGFPDHSYCIHQLTASCQLVAIFTQGIPWHPHAMFWDNGLLYVTCLASRDITVFQPVYQGGLIGRLMRSLGLGRSQKKLPINHSQAEQTVPDVLVSDERKQPITEKTSAVIEHGVVITHNLLEQLNKAGAVPIKTKEQLDLFLRFQHETGNILYFSVESLKEWIVLDPKWLIDALKSLITAETFVLSNYPAVRSMWFEFKENGKLTCQLIDAIWTKQKHPEFYQNKEMILQLMEKLNIVARPRLYNLDAEEGKVEGYFLAPCMLRQATPKYVITLGPDSRQRNTSVICFVFTGKFLPTPVFHRLLAACVAQWPIAKQNMENLIFCGCCIFDLDLHHRLTLLFREHGIFARVRIIGTIDNTPSYKLCIEVREFLTRTLCSIIGCLKQSLQFELSIQCPQSDRYSVDYQIPVATLQGNVDVPCHFHDKSHVIVSHDVLKFWFQEEQTNDLVEQIYSRKSDLAAPEKHKLFLPPGKKYHAFFSYASPDIQWVKEIVETLESDHGFICCEYDRDNTPGRPLLQFAEDSIQNACKTVVVMTKEAFKSGFVKHEIQMALQQGFDTGRKCVVPVLVQDCTIPAYLRIVNYVDARNPNQRDIWWPKLLTELQTQDVVESNQINQQLIERTATELDDGNIKEEQQQLYKTTENETWV